MEERLNLGLPSRNVDPPKSRFEIKDGSSRGSSILIPFFVAAWASLLKQCFTEDKVHAAPEPKSGHAPSIPVQNSDAVEENVNQPIRVGSGAASVAKMAGITWSIEGTSLGSSAIELGDFQLVWTPMSRARPSLNLDDSVLPRVRPSNDNHQALPSGGSGGGGGGGGGGATGDPGHKPASDTRGGGGGNDLVKALQKQATDGRPFRARSI